MGYFKPEVVEELVVSLRDTIDAIKHVKERVLRHPFQQPRASEYAAHGICRRLGTLIHCAERVYELLPPSLEIVPEEWNVNEATVHIQTFLSNEIGILDNLAWVWISERELKNKDGSDFHFKQVKLSRDCRVLWRDLPLEFRGKIIEFRPWLENVYEWRDALAHRIPLYIPPFSVRDVEEYKKVDEAAYQAWRKGDYQKYTELNDKAECMKFFTPLIQHSFWESSQPNVFHANLIADLKTVSLLIELMMDFFENPTVG